MGSSLRDRGHRRILGGPRRDADRRIVEPQHHHVAVDAAGRQPVARPRARREHDLEAAVGAARDLLAADWWHRPLCGGAAPLRHAGRRRDADREGRPDARGRAELSVIHWLLWLLGGLLLGGIVHLATVLFLPRTATQDAYTRLAATAPANGIVPLPLRRRMMRCCHSWTRPSRRLCAATILPPGRSSCACRSAGLYVGVFLCAQRRRLLCHQRPRGRPAHHRARFDDDGSARRVPDDEEVTAADRLIVESPTPTGLILIRTFGPEPGLMPMARRALAAAEVGQQGYCYLVISGRGRDGEFLARAARRADRPEARSPASASAPAPPRPRGDGTAMTRRSSA